MPRDPRIEAGPLRATTRLRIAESSRLPRQRRADLKEGTMSLSPAKAIAVGLTSAYVVPQAFCWTRFGTEAGQPIEHILERKETERLQNDGLFFWGIGNSIGLGIDALLRRTSEPEVLFSAIKGPPRAVDVRPGRVVAWTMAVDLAGNQIGLPPSVRVLSRSTEPVPKRQHYALVCSADTPLERSDLGRVQMSALRNLRSGSPVGASQVSAVVERTDDESDLGAYIVEFRARLVPPYFVRLSRPITAEADRAAYANDMRPT